MKTKCVSIRLISLVRISNKAYKATDFNGNSDIIPASQVFDCDCDVTKSEAYWIAEWILNKKSLTYSSRKIAWFNHDTNRLEPNIIVERHIPKKKECVSNNTIPELLK